MTVSIRGMERTKLALKRVQAEIELASPAAVGEAGKVVASAMASRAPRRTGALASSIGVSVQSLGDGATASVGATQFYDPFVQFGHGSYAGVKYAEDAATASGPGVVAAMLAVYKAAVE